MKIRTLWGENMEHIAELGGVVTGFNVIAHCIGKCLYSRYADVDQDAGMGVDGECAERAGRGAAEGEREKAAGRSVGEPVGEPAKKVAREMVGGISEKIAERETGKAVICPQADNPAKVDNRERNKELFVRAN